METHTKRLDSSDSRPQDKNLRTGGGKDGRRGVGGESEQRTVLGIAFLLTGLSCGRDVADDEAAGQASGLLSGTQLVCTIDDW